LGTIPNEKKKGQAQKAIDALLSKDLIEKDEESRYRLTDPIMGKWLCSE